jgi:thiol-disulfide isomerase/thioredoxin
VSLIHGSASAAAVGDPAPEISAKEWLNGGPYNLANLQDKVAVVEFWATWCPPCCASIPHLNALHDKYSGKGVVIIGLTNQPQSKIKDFVNKQDMRYVIGCGSNSARDFGISTIPNAFVIVNGEIFWHGHPTEGLDQALAAALRTPRVAKRVQPAPQTIAPVSPKADAADSASADTQETRTGDLLHQVTYILKDGRRIEAEKATEVGEEWAVKDKSGEYHMLRKSEVEKVIK